MTQTVRYDVSLLSEDDLFLFNEGSHFRLYRKLGAHPLTVDDTAGTYFAALGPRCRKGLRHWGLQQLGQSLPSHGAPWPIGPLGCIYSQVGPGAFYKFHIHSRFQMYKVDKADALGFD